MTRDTLEQESSGETIYKQVALDAIENEYKGKANEVLAHEIVNIMAIIDDIPPVNPTKTGHWEQYGNSWEDKFKCSECGKEQPKILCGEQIIGHWSDYCPNCGCRMFEPQERSEE